jgi:subfamily B ATP-binding cassette protein MsbA
MMNDVNVMQDAFTTTFQKLLVEPLNILFFGTILFIIDWKLSLVALLTLPLAGFLYVSVGVSIRRKSKRIQEKIASIMHILTEVLYSIRVIKAFVTKRYEIQKFEKEGNRYFHLLFRRAKLDNLATPINEIIGVLIGVVLLWYGGMQVIQTETLTSEDFLRFILVLFAMLAPIKTLGTVNITIQNSLAAAERVFNILDLKPDINDKPDAKEIESFSEEIRFDNVSFDYGEESAPVLKNVSFSISKGSVVALVGASGAGKSTIADLIPRFYDTTSGYVKIDGEDIREIKLESLRRMMGIVSQEIILFNDTVKQNIAYGQEEIKDSNIISAAKAANAMGFIEELPNGLDTIIGERGVKISGGQKQRLSIARAIIKNPPLLILDEATSSLDTESEKLVQEALKELMIGRTVLVIAHRLSTVQSADKIIVLERGRIVEEGSHKELLSLNGKYAEFYDVQFQIS